jgi:hypothetical protein
MRVVLTIAGAVALGVIGTVCLLFGVAVGLTLVGGETEYVGWFLALITIIALALGLAALVRAVALFRARS